MIAAPQPEAQGLREVPKGQKRSQEDERLANASRVLNSQQACFTIVMHTCCKQSTILAKNGTGTQHSNVTNPQKTALSTYDKMICTSSTMTPCSCS